MIEKFVSYIKNEPKVIFDIGSRDCQQAVEFSKTFPNAKVYAFECNPNTLSLCRENSKGYNITLIDKAVNIYDGVCTFYPIDQEKTITSWSDGNPGASSLFKTNGKYTIERYVQNEITVPCIRLDTVIKNNNIDVVDVIWMDLQGAELLALQSLGDFLHTVNYIHVEVTYQEMYTGQVLFEELDSFMNKNNFIKLTEPTYQGWQQDLIYKRNI
jgi:FkbM family methyltransferase